ncbi:MAG: sulfite exporter TauE/SafE family protein [Arenicellales bacterium]
MGVTDLLSVGSGSLVGFSLGLLGGGGSILAVPLLVYLVGVGSTHLAIGTSALAVAVNAFANLIPHSRAGNVKWPCALVFAICGIAGAAGGAALGKSVDGTHLLFLFGLVMVAVALAMLTRRAAAAGDPDVRITPTIAVQLAGTGLLVGALSGFFGIGGGFLIVPAIMLGAGMATINAVASSLVSVGAFGLTTAASYALAGMVDWRVACFFILGGVLGGLAGTKLAGRLSGRRGALTRIFAVVVLVVAGFILWRSARTMLG